MRVIKVRLNTHPHPKGNGPSDRKYTALFVNQGVGRGEVMKPASGPIAFVSRGNPGLITLYLLNYSHIRISCPEFEMIYPHVGTFKGKTEVFDAMSYRHQRNVMNDNLSAPFEEGSLKVGPKGHRVSLGNVGNAVRNAADWVDSPLGKVAEKFVDTRYFLALLTKEQNILFNHQTSGIVLMPIGPKKQDGSAWTLGDLVSLLGAQMQQAFG